MPNVLPITFQSIGLNEGLVAESGAMPFNEFNQGVITEKYKAVRISIYSDSKQQVQNPMIIDYVDANGNKKLINKTPRVDNYQLNNQLNCIELPEIPCDGLNRFTYTILPNCQVFMLIEVDKRLTLSEVLKCNSDFSDQNSEAMEDAMVKRSKVLQSPCRDYEETHETIDGQEYYHKQTVNIKINRIKGYSNAEGVQTKPNYIKYGLVALSLFAILWGVSKIVGGKSEN